MDNEKLWTCMDAAHPLSGGKWSVAVGYIYRKGKPICRELSTTAASTYNSERHESATDGNNLVLFNAYQHFGYTHDMHVCKNWAEGGNAVILGGLKAYWPFSYPYRIRCRPRLEACRMGASRAAADLPAGPGLGRISAPAREANARRTLRLRWFSERAADDDTLEEGRLSLDTARKALGSGASNHDEF